MLKSPIALAVALLGCIALPALAQTPTSPEFKFSGFGTLAAVNSSEHQADFVGTLFQPNGAGHTKSTSFAPDSKLGGQVNATFGDKFSGVVQLVVQHQYDNSYTPQIEWANIKYALTPEFSVRLGRIAVPSFQISESRLVGYANPWVRPPNEVYSVLPITSSDGVDATYRSTVAGANNTLQAFYGFSTVKLAGGGDAKSKPVWGFNDSVEFGSFTLRASFVSASLTFDIPSLNGLINGLSQFSAGASGVPVPAFQATAAQAAALAQKYSLQDMSLSAVALSAGYDPGDWFVIGEFVDLNGSSILSDSRSWYVSAGYLSHPM